MTTPTSEIIPQKQIQELFCVAPSTLKEWKNNTTNKKHNLGIFLSSLDYEITKKEIEKLKMEKCEIFGLIISTRMIV